MDWLVDVIMYGDENRIPFSVYIWYVLHDVFERTNKPDLVLCGYLKSSFSRITPGRGEGDGEGPGPHASDHAQVHADEGQHPGRESEDHHAQISELDGAGHEGSHQGHEHHEQVRKS